MSFVYKADPARGAAWAALFAARRPDLAFHLWPETGDPGQVRFLAAWQPPEDICGRFPRLELLFSVGAGVDQFDLDALPPALSLVRMVEPGIVQSMVQYVSFAVLALHRGMPAYLAQQREGRWKDWPVRLASQTRVGVLGLGELGLAALRQLQQFGFECAGWSRTRHILDGVPCHAGAAELSAFLARTDILVCLLPLTGATQGLMDASLFDALPRGAALVNVGRGGHLVQEDLLQALNRGQLAAAVLDVCDPEPLPAGHPFWSHPKIWLTPHVASQTQPETAVPVVLENLRRHEAGEPLIGLVDRVRGY